jgi:putative heme-binding domain-containing protein
MYIGPDGALYVIDYYRQIIEHPEWLSEEVIHSGALYRGANQGRIYRITPKSTRKMDWTNALSLGRASTPELVRALASPNIWWRRQAQRLLVDRKDPAAVPLLQTLLDSTASATAFVHGLWTLEGFGALDTAWLVKALRHPDPGVRENALQISEHHLPGHRELSGVLASMQTDPDPRVRFQLVCTLGELEDASSEVARQSLLLRDIDDHWMQVAALSSVRSKEWALLEKILPVLHNQPSAGKALFFGNVAGLIGLSQRGEDVRKVTEMATRVPRPGDDWWQAALLQGLGKGLAVKGVPAGDMEAEKTMLLSTYRPSFAPSIQDAALDLLGIIGPPGGPAWDAALARAEHIAMDSGQQAFDRVSAFKVLGLDREKDFGPLVESVIRSRQHPSVQQAALGNYQRYSAEKAAALVVKYWDSPYFAAGGFGMDVLLGSEAGMQQLLDALEKKRIATAAIPWSGKVDLMNHEQAAIRTRARALLAPEIERREQVVSDYQEALTLKGDVARGQAVFQLVCGSCHPYEGRFGKTFGPDLGSIRNRDKASIMTDILQPNCSIAVQYDMWTVVMKNGEKHSGIIHAQTPTSIQLTPAGGNALTLARAEIQRMEISKTSAMPEGLEATISKQQMADLLAFLKEGEIEGK